MAQQNYNPPLSRHEYELAMLRSGEIREALKTQGIPVYKVAAYLDRNPQTVYRWLSTGLTAGQHDDLYHAVSDLALANLTKGQGARR